MFDLLPAQMKAIYDRPTGNFGVAGAPLRPMAEGVKEMLNAGGDKIGGGHIPGCERDRSSACERLQDTRGGPEGGEQGADATGCSLRGSSRDDGAVKEGDGEIGELNKRT